VRADEDLAVVRDASLPEVERHVTVFADLSSRFLYLRDLDEDQPSERADRDGAGGWVVP
jgi:hypothetical protein